mmetsp:Transcript_2954/g.5711  ORF Transcript_2954/g.5711 Transcript_2954/m.5711 type:complete len:92 (+) Transcript_2954:445-720(+)
MRLLRGAVLLIASTILPLRSNHREMDTGRGRVIMIDESCVHGLVRARFSFLGAIKVMYGLESLLQFIGAESSRPRKKPRDRTHELRALARM